MEGKVCLVTGATSGIGRETARALAMKGASVIVAGRDARRTHETAEAIARESGREVGTMTADLSLMPEVKRLAREVVARHSRLDVLVNNAGNLFTAQAKTPEGFERTWALNHLSPMLLTLELLPLLKSSAPARIVNVASDTYRFGKLDFADLQGEGRFRGLKAYANAKLANVMFTFALALRLEGTGVTANCLHPGFVSTGIGNEMNATMRFIQNVLLQPFRISPEKGARTSIHLAASKDVEGVSGRYFEKCREARVAAVAGDIALKERLWKESVAQLSAWLDDASMIRLENEGSIGIAGRGENRDSPRQSHD